MTLKDARAISYCYVAVVDNLPENLQLPPVTNTFASTFFENPQRTVIVPQPDGSLSIQCPAGDIMRAYSFHPKKIQVMCENAFEVMKTFGKGFEWLRKAGLTIESKRYGLNYEFDFEVEDSDATRWIAKKLLRNDSGARKQADVGMVSTLFDVKGVDSLRTLRLEPRAKAQGRVFAYANLEYQGSKVLVAEPLESALSEGFQRAVELVGQFLGD